ncbi:ABC transporter permease [Aquabacterium sp. A7-Y]|uniref:ABC transporter permease n=1 Tax=Aquabacterium sp. A7-Y TaxID=1349605 RepID=UPI00223E168C|nr:ABC transporter permease [Aquabacterium sp. A7-Y]MCW7540172.1 ABC transporter permease [Aquabacterium sp. A7-Y]
MPPTSTLAFRERLAPPVIDPDIRRKAPGTPAALPPPAWHGPLTRLLLAWPFPLAVLVLWQVAASHELVPVQILPPPAAVAATFLDLYQQGELQMHASISLQRVVCGFALGGGLGLVLGTVMGLSNTAKEVLYPSFKVFAQVPSLGWLPLLMLLVGIDEALKIILISKAAFVPITMNTFQGIRNVPPAFIEVARVYRFSGWQLVRKVVFPAAFPPIWSGVRYGLTHAWLALVGVELLASSEGVGYLIVYGRQLYQLDVVLAAVVVVGGVGFVLDKLLALVETRLLRWRRDSF